ncbi:MAG: hypothetical protein WC914_01940 [Proteiniphilum sp.]
MKTTRRLFIRNLSLATAATVVPARFLRSCTGNNHFKEKEAPALIVDIDFNDEVIIRPGQMTEQDVEELVHGLHDNGVDIILVRMGYLGYLPYHTDLSYPVGFDEEHARRYPFTKDSQFFEKWMKERAEHNKRYNEVLKTFNPPEVFIRVGHELGMKVIMWIDLFDDMYSGHRSKFIDNHPHCQWTARDGETYFNGIISYAWEEARAFRVTQAIELLDLGADGIHCSTSAHARHLPNVQENDFYGFEKPIVDEYMKRFGIDITRDDSFDRDEWHTIKGEFMNHLYRELAEVCHQRGKELWIGLQLGDYTNLSADPHFSTNVVARYRNLWKELVTDSIADAFIIGDYELCSQPNHPYWSAKELAPPPGPDLFSWAADYYQEFCKNKTKLYLFGEWLAHAEPDIDKQLTEWAERVLANGFDGIDIHEAANFENPSTKMRLLRRMKNRLQGREVDFLVY